MLHYHNVNLISRKISEFNSRDDAFILSEIFGKRYCPIIASPMKDVCNGRIASTMERNGCFGIIHRFMTISEQVNEVVLSEIRTPVCAIGINGDYIDRYKALLGQGVNHFCIDVANSSSVKVKNAVKELLNISPAKFIVGNSVSVEGVNYYNDMPEVEAIRVGVAGGLGCTTRNTTGVFHPMVNLLLECRNTDKVIIADGGIKEPRDYCIALACGADFVMFGSLIARTQDSPAELIDKDGKQYKLYHGSASYENQKNYKAIPRYIEGRSVLLDYDNEQLGDLIVRFNDGLRSSMSYCNAFDLQEYRNNVEVIRN